MDSIRTFINNSRLVDKTGTPTMTIPAPADFFFTVAEGDPLILTDVTAVSDDLVVVFNDEGSPIELGRVTVGEQPGTLYMICEKGRVIPLPQKEQYRVVEFCLHRHHASAPEIEGKFRPYYDEFPPDLV